MDSAKSPAFRGMDYTKVDGSAESFSELCGSFVRKGDPPLLRPLDCPNQTIRELRAEREARLYHRFERAFAAGRRHYAIPAFAWRGQNRPVDPTFILAAIPAAKGALQIAGRARAHKENYTYVEE